jgi:predicted DNA-binding transcriptional regulator YafY
MTYGKRESQWMVMRRCLAILRRVQRGPARRDELVCAVLDQEGADAYGGAEGKALSRRLENDLRRIREGLMIDLYYDRQVGGYVLVDAWLPLLDLPDEDLETIAWLEQIFDHDSPQHDEVHALLGRLRSFLSPERRGEIERSRTALVVDLGQRDEDRIAPLVWENLTSALGRRRVELTYLSPQQPDGAPRRHVVDPYERFFDTVRGHYYLRGWCHYTDGPLGRRDQRRYFYYRLGRIADVRILPDVLPPIPPAAPRYAVAYELAPRVARLGVTRHRDIEIAEIQRREDGRALVHGETQNLFWTVRTLLHYGPNCRVLGGPELLREMRQVVHKMADMYENGG